MLVKLHSNSSESVTTIRLSLGFFSTIAELLVILLRNRIRFLENQNRKNSITRYISYSNASYYIIFYNMYDTTTR